MTSPPPRQGRRQELWPLVRTSRRVPVRPARIPVSTRMSPRVLLLGVLAVLLAASVVVWSVSLGDFSMSPAEVVRAALGIGDVPPEDAFIVRALRLPRALGAALTGAALAASGALFQGLLRNPLVAPDIIGVNAGAGLVAVFMIVVTESTALLPAGAFAGAVVTAFGVYLFAWRKGVTGSRLVLVGIGVNALLAALTTVLIVSYPIEQVSSAVLWQTGTLYLAGWPTVLVLLAGLAILLPAGLWLTRYLGALQLGDDIARSLGVRVERTRGALLLVGAGLAAVAVSAGGPIGFVALITPHIARLLAGPLTAGVLALSAALGAVLLGVADLVAQHAVPSVSLPVGVVTAAVGAPYFLLLLHRASRVG